MKRQIYTSLSISELVDHPENAKLFGDEPDSELVDSIETNGVITPPIVAYLSKSSYRIISGHSRVNACKKLGKDSVYCLVRRDMTPLEIDEAWAESNVQREMTNEQKARWYKIRKRIEEFKAKERHRANGGDKKSEAAKSAPPNSAEPIESTESRDVAAAEVGWGRSKAESAESVVDAIDKAEEAGDIETAEDLRETLEHKSVHAAAEKVKQYNDTFNVDEIEGKKPRKPVKEKNPAPLANSLITKQCSSLAKGIDDVAEVSGWKRKSKRVGYHKAANDALNGLIGALKELAKGKLQ